MLHVILVLALAWVVRRAWRRRARDESGPAPADAGKHWALALAQPMVEMRGPINFRHLNLGPMRKEEHRATCRGPLLHQLGCRLDASDDQVRQHLTAFEQNWLRLDLQDLRDTDDPRAALAFACVRVTYLARMAMIMEWTPADSAWRVLLLNAQRARECFDGWEDFGRAYLTGRAQWIAAMRADPSLGAPFDEPRLHALLDRRNKDGWGQLHWPGPVLKLP